jgi:hypothetical protein
MKKKFKWYLTPDELANNIRKNWHKHAQDLRNMLEKSRDIRLKYKHEE